MNNPISDPFVEVPDSDALSPFVRLEATPDGVATVTINKAATRNAFDAQLIGALRETFETLHSADGVRIVFLTGAGVSFCAGADLDWMRAAREWTEAENREDAMGLAVMLKALYDIPAMTVALVNGPAMGGGAGLVAACDYAVAIPEAKFCFSEVKLGLTPATISPYVVSAIGARRARALFASAQLFDAATAQHIGLIDEIGDLTEAKQRLSAQIASCAPGAIGEAKRLVADVVGKEFNRHLMEETAKRIASQRVSPEGREGVAAFLDKRKANWSV